MDVNSMLAGAGIMAVLMGFIWGMFAYYDRKNESRFVDIDRRNESRFVDIDRKNETRFADVRKENREAHAGITERVDRVLEMLAKR